MNENLRNLIQTASQAGAETVLMRLGKVSGELSRRAAIKTYGKYFADLEKSGRIRPCRVENGKTGTRFFLIQDILTIKMEDLCKAELR